MLDSMQDSITAVPNFITRVGGARILSIPAACMNGFFSIIMSYNLNKPHIKKLSTKAKQTNGGTKIFMIMIFNSNSLKNKNGHKQEITRFLMNRNQKDVGIKKSATGPQCKPTRSKHGMVTRLTC